MVKFAKEVEEEIRNTVVQAQRKDDGVYGWLLFFLIKVENYGTLVCFLELKMTKNTTKLDNVIYDDNAVIDKPRPPSQRCKK